jgi:hypothetical protein
MVGWVFYLVPYVQLVNMLIIYSLHAHLWMIFWQLFNALKIRHISLKLSSISDLWDSGLQLVGLDRIFALSIFAVACWV